MSDENRKLRNWEVVVYALYLSDGVSRNVHTEDVALRCFELAPRSFSWIKHTQYPDKDIVRMALTNARKPEVTKVGSLVTGRSGRGLGKAAKTGRSRAGDGWRLTESGAAWVVENDERIEAVLGRSKGGSRRQDVMRKISKVREHRLFQAFQEMPAGFTPPIGQVAELLRCRVDAEELVWRKRFESFLGQAQLARQVDVVEFLRVCEKAVMEEIG